MEAITFENINTIGNIIDENELYRHYHYPEMLTRYDSNFIAFKVLPSLSDFITTEHYLREFHQRNAQNHVKFYFPENQKPTQELADYLNANNYDYGFLELYAIHPTEFPAVHPCEDIEIQVVTRDNLHILQRLQYQHDLENGEPFANQKQALIARQFEDSGTLQLLAFYKEKPAGYADLILADRTVEIDNLTVEENYRKKGIGSRLQRYVMDSFSDKIIILVADGEDTPRNMYQKQNYHYLGFQYEMQKIYER